MDANDRTSPRPDESLLSRRADLRAFLTDAREVLADAFNHDGITATTPLVLIQSAMDYLAAALRIVDGKEILEEQEEPTPTMLDEAVQNMRRLIAAEAAKIGANEDGRIPPEILARIGVAKIAYEMGKANEGGRAHG